MLKVDLDTLTILSPHLRAIHTIGSLRMSAGGPTRTVTALSQGLGRLGVIVDLVSQTRSDTADDDNLIPPHGTRQYDPGAGLSIAGGWQTLGARVQVAFGPTL